MWYKKKSKIGHVLNFGAFSNGVLFRDTWFCFQFVVSGLVRISSHWKLIYVCRGEAWGL